MNNVASSCDTFVTISSASPNNKTIFAKNSDRPVNEAQPLVSYPSMEYQKGNKLECTYITIDQAQHTNAVIGSKPYWIWGFEHGVNEYGVAIGNEAVFSKEEVEDSNGLLGMDMLRLSLERGKSSYECLHIVIDLLERFGQGGVPSRLKTKYHNSFIFADKNEAWILETSNRFWITKKIKDVASISNIYSIEYEWDEVSPGLIDYAFSKGWTSSKDDFNFSKSFMGTNQNLIGGQMRCAQSSRILQSKKGNITLKDLMVLLRDHYENTDFKPRWAPNSGIYQSICMHASDYDSYQTAASTVIELGDPVSDFIYWNSFSRPCTSIFQPVFNTHFDYEQNHIGTEKYSSNSKWWEFEKLSLEIDKDYTKFAPIARKIFDEYENMYFEELDKLKKNIITMDEKEKSKKLNDFSLRCINNSEKAINEIYLEIKKLSCNHSENFKNSFIKKVLEEAY